MITTRRGRQSQHTRPRKKTGRRTSTPLGPIASQRVLFVRIPGDMDTQLDDRVAQLRIARGNFALSRADVVREILYRALAMA